MKTKSIYIHIPFCETICSYCDFCKVLYQSKWVDQYLEALDKEIKARYQQEIIDTIYIGGGTPSSLTLEQLAKLFEITNQFHKSKQLEFTIECNIEHITEEKLRLFKKAGINRISYGVQTFHTKYLKYLNRHHTKDEVLAKIELTKHYIPNINVDLMYAFQKETVEEVKEDIELFLQLDIPHISTYSLIIEPHTVLGIKEQYIDDTLDATMYEIICHTLKQHGFLHYEVSNFCKPEYQSKHNLTYWNNGHYYGFGMGASGYINHVRYTNTRSINHYLSLDYDYQKEELTQQVEMENELILGLRKLQGVSITNFYQKYQKQVEEVFDIASLVKKGLLEVQEGYIRIPENKIYLSNEVLIHFIGDV